ncbi:hypothetical protein EDC04DRAFT_2838169, partial [Pisolithus marmoratus]
MNPVCLRLSPPAWAAEMDFFDMPRNVVPYDHPFQFYRTPLAKDPVLPRHTFEAVDIGKMECAILECDGNSAFFADVIAPSTLNTRVIGVTNRTCSGRVSTLNTGHLVARGTFIGCGQVSVRTRTRNSPRIVFVFIEISVVVHHTRGDPGAEVMGNVRLMTLCFVIGRSGESAIAEHMCCTIVDGACCMKPHLASGRDSLRALERLNGEGRSEMLLRESRGWGGVKSCVVIGGSG